MCVCVCELVFSFVFDILALFQMKRVDIVSLASQSQKPTPNQPNGNSSSNCMHFTILRIRCFFLFSFCPISSSFQSSFAHSLSSFDFNCINASTCIYVWCACVCLYGVIILLYAAHCIRIVYVQVESHCVRGQSTPSAQTSWKEKD